jgi:hypothetical protein
MRRRYHGPTGANRVQPLLSALRMPGEAHPLGCANHPSTLAPEDARAQPSGLDLLHREYLDRADIGISGEQLRSNLT